MRRFPWVLTAVCAIAVSLLCSLGVWQVQRLQWKQRLIAQAEAAARLPRASLAEALGQPEFRAVTVTCPGLATAPYVELRAIEDGEAGVRLISTCRPAKFTFPILVDRGFVADAISARPPVAPSDVAVTVEGQLRTIPAKGAFAPVPQGRTFFTLDAVAMPKVLGETPAAPHIIFATTSSNPEWLALKPSAPPPAFSNNHLGYALTWFGLALALAGFYIALLLRKLKS